MENLKIWQKSWVFYWVWIENIQFITITAVIVYLLWFNGKVASTQKHGRKWKSSCQKSWQMDKKNHTVKLN